MSCGGCGRTEICESQQCVDLVGDTCEHPFEVGALPFQVDGNTKNTFNDYHFWEDDCPGVAFTGGTSEAENVYRFVPPQTTEYLVKLTKYFGVLYVAEDCGDIGGTCLGADNSQNEQVFVGTLSGGEDYWIFVDGSLGGYSAFELLVDYAP